MRTSRAWACELRKSEKPAAALNGSTEQEHQRRPASGTSYPVSSEKLFMKATSKSSFHGSRWARWSTSEDTPRGETDGWKSSEPKREDKGSRKESTAESQRLNADR